jgi:ABC-2 type transport system permease protein
MKTMKWLLRREFWEYKGSLLWAPAIVGTLMVLFVAFSAAYGAATGKFDSHVTHTVDGQTTTTSISKFAAMAPEVKQEMADKVAGAYLLSAAPLYLMLSVIIFFYCLSALNEERRDRSILFWKSLPVSDGQTVLSKVITAALVAPLITIAIGTFVSLLFMLIIGLGMASQGVNMFAPVLSNSNFYLAPLRVLGMLPVYVLWALPTIGWLLMVSAWAKSKVFLWAVGTPLITIIIVKWVNIMLGGGIDINWFAQNIVARALLGLFPGSWLGSDKFDPQTLVGDHQAGIIGSVFTHSWMTLAGPSVWIGAIAGCAMIFAAMRLRRWKDEG